MTEKLTLDQFTARFVADLVEDWGEGARETAMIDAPLWYDEYLKGHMTLEDCVAAAPDDWEIDDD